MPGRARSALVISIAAGTLDRKICDSGSTHRARSCAPCRTFPPSIGKGITAAYATPQVRPPHSASSPRHSLRAVGDMVWLDGEELSNAVTAVSGSGPAYVFLLAEALAKAAERVGLHAGHRAQARAQDRSKAPARFWLERKEAAEELRRSVTSPGGTTEAALKILMAERGLEPLLRARSRRRNTRAATNSADSR